MTDKEEYGLEDICTSMDALETQLSKMNDYLLRLLKFFEESKIA